MATPLLLCQDMICQTYPRLFLGSINPVRSKPAHKLVAASAVADVNSENNRETVLAHDIAMDVSQVNQDMLQAAPALAKLQGKVAIVTGASAGIGKACVEALAAAGMKVVACARRQERLDALQVQLEATGMQSGNFLGVKCDVCSEQDIKNVLQVVTDKWDQPPAVLINNAGLSLDDTTILEGSSDSWAQMMNTNVLAVAAFTREAVAAMRRHGAFGHIVNISSMSAYRIPKFAGGAFYAATKHALRCVSDGTRIEAQQQGLPLRVSCVSPGVVETEFYHVRHRGDVAAATTAYDYEALAPAHIVQAVLYAVGAPEGVNVDDVIVRSTGQML